MNYQRIRRRRKRRLVLVLLLLLLLLLIIIIIIMGAKEIRVEGPRVRHRQRVAARRRREDVNEYDFDIRKKKMSIQKRSSIHCCALSFLPFGDHPVVSLKSGAMYDLDAVLPYVMKHKKDPVTGETMKTSDLKPLKLKKCLSTNTMEGMIKYCTQQIRVPNPGKRIYERDENMRGKKDRYVF